jgi:hypothetical protein
MNNKVKVADHADAIPGKFTVQLTIKPLMAYVNSIKFRLHENLQIEIKDHDAEVNGNGKFEFEKNKIKKPDYNLLHFNASESNIWLSICHDMNVLKNNFIKIGMGYVYENNTILHFKLTTGINNSSEFVKTCKEIIEIEFDSKFLEIVKKHIEIVPLLKDHTTLVYTENDMKLPFLTEYFTMPKDLPTEAQGLYERIIGRNVDINEEIINAINFSIENEGSNERSLYFFLYKEDNKIRYFKNLI